MQADQQSSTEQTEAIQQRCMTKSATRYHKPGTSDVKNIDESGDLIYNPQTADRGMYECFVGFYYVGYENY